MKKSMEGSECPDLEHQPQTTPHNDRLKNKVTNQNNEDKGDNKSQIKITKPQ